jgi:protein-tyrosine-phosphatase
MAAAFARKIGGVHVLSAGSDPANSLNPTVVLAMEEKGISLSELEPQRLTDEMARTADVVVTMGCGDACPYYPGKRYVDWDLPDPAGRGPQEVRIIRDDIENRVIDLLHEIQSA